MRYQWSQNLWDASSALLGCLQPNRKQQALGMKWRRKNPLALLYRGSPIGATSEQRLAILPGITHRHRGPIVTVYLEKWEDPVLKHLDLSLGAVFMTDRTKSTKVRTKHPISAHPCLEYYWLKGVSILLRDTATCKQSRRKQSQRTTHSPWLHSRKPSGQASLHWLMASGHFTLGTLRGKRDRASLQTESWFWCHVHRSTNTEDMVG